MSNNTLLFLGPENSPLLSWLKLVEPYVINTEEKINKQYIEENNVVYLISYGYRHIISKDVIFCLSGKAINLHISYLPWNKGADPNFWSFIEGTVKGITIHYIDEYIDCGDILVQKQVFFDFDEETLKSSYDKLNIEVINIFKEYWQFIKHKKIHGVKQAGKGSYHKTIDKNYLFNRLEKGWDTKVSDLLKYVKS